MISANVERTAAARLGMGVEEWRARRAAGEKWCYRCRTWHPRAAFTTNRSKSDGLSDRCRLRRPQDLIDDGATLRVPLLDQDGHVRAYATIDADDRRVGDRRWCYSNGYVVGTEGRPRPRLHRMILGLDPNDPRQGDHVNRNPLDNRRANLRIATHPQNSQNKGSSPGSSSAYRGVSWDRRRQLWKATAGVNGRQVQIGRFDSESEAAMAVAAWRARHMPFSLEALPVPTTPTQED